MKPKKIVWLTKAHAPFLTYGGTYKIVKWIGDQPVIVDNQKYPLLLNRKSQYKYA